MIQGSQNSAIQRRALAETRSSSLEVGRAHNGSRPRAVSPIRVRFRQNIYILNNPSRKSIIRSFDKSMELLWVSCFLSVEREFKNLQIFTIQRVNY